MKTCKKRQLLPLLITVMIPNKSLCAYVITYFKIFNTFWNLVYKNLFLFLETKTNHANVPVFPQ